MNSNTCAEGGARKGVLWGLAAAVLCLAHFAWLYHHFEPVITGPDANGYFAQARRIAESGRASFQRESGLQYINMHWLTPDGSHFVSRYPPGLPLILAAALRLGGPAAAMLVNPALTSATLFGLFLLGRAWAGPAWGLAAAMAMAVNPTANGWAFMGDAHPAVAFFLVWGIWFLTGWTAQTTPAKAFLIGLWLGYIPTLRYPEVIYGLGFAWFLLSAWKCGGASLRALAAAAAGGATPLAALAIHEASAWGTLGRTGYSAGTPLFTWQYFTAKLIPYLQATQSGGAGLFAALGAAGIVWLAVRRESRREGLLLALLVVPPTLLYAAYFFHDATMRFLLPTFYLYAAAGACLLKALADAQPAAGRAAAAACLGITVLIGGSQSASSLASQQGSRAGLVKAVEAIANQTPAGSVLIAPQNLAQHLDFLGRWRLADAQLFTDNAGGPMGGPPGGAGGGPGGGGDLMQELTQSGERAKTRARYLSSEGDFLPQLWTDLAAWSAGREVYWVGEKEEITEAVGAKARVAVVAKLQLPRGGMGPAGGPPGGPGGRMGGPMGGMGPPGGFGGPGGGGPPGGPFGRGGQTVRAVLAKLELAPSGAAETP